MAYIGDQFIDPEFHLKKLNPAAGRTDVIYVGNLLAPNSPYKLTWRPEQFESTSYGKILRAACGIELGTLNKFGNPTVVRKFVLAPMTVIKMAAGPVGNHFTGYTKTEEDKDEVVTAFSKAKYKLILGSSAFDPQLKEETTGRSKFFLANKEFFRNHALPTLATQYAENPAFANYDIVTNNDGDAKKIEKDVMNNYNLPVRENIDPEDDTKSRRYIVAENNVFHTTSVKFGDDQKDNNKKGNKKFGSSKGSMKVPSFIKQAQPTTVESKEQQKSSSSGTKRKEPSQMSVYEERDYWKKNHIPMEIAKPDMERLVLDVFETRLVADKKTGKPKWVEKWMSPDRVVAEITGDAIVAPIVRLVASAPYSYKNKNGKIVNKAGKIRADLLGFYYYGPPKKYAGVEHKEVAMDEDLLPEGLDIEPEASFVEPAIKKQKIADDLSQAMVESGAIDEEFVPTSPVKTSNE